MKQILIFLILVVGRLYAGGDPLPSWNEGPAKKAIFEFVKETTQEGGSNYIAPKDRIATFDEDGTLWVEQPLYTEFIYAIDKVKELAPQHPEWTNREPFKSVIEGNLEAVKGFNKYDIAQLMGATHAGMTIDEFHNSVREWLKKAVHPRFKKPFTELTYQPMLELMRYFKDNHFDVYVVSGGGQEFMRAFAESLYGLPPGHIIGTTGKVQYEFREGKPALLKLSELLFIDDKQGKPEGINLIIGKHPVAAIGNSIGDQQMLEWTGGKLITSDWSKGKRLEILVHHDDAEREYAYGPDSKIGTFSDALMDEAKRQEWIVVSMRNDWKVIFSWQNPESDF